MQAEPSATAPVVTQLIEWYKPCTEAGSSPDLMLGSGVILLVAMNELTACTTASEAAREGLLGGVRLALPRPRSSVDAVDIRGMQKIDAALEARSAAVALG